jgi:hydroxypyruvate isomerase
MPRLAANLTMLFTELPFLDRFDAAAAAGFRAVECIAPYVVPAQAVRDRLEALSLDLARHYAQATGARTLHLMAGKIAPDADRAAWTRTLVENVRLAADTLAADGVTIVLEPINTRVDIPGYFYDTTAAVLAVMDAADRPNVKLLYDIYHMQIMEGDLARTLERLLPRIGHVQIADNPGRGEPGTGEISYPWLLSRLDALGYDGWVGCEYRPAGETTAGLGWAKAYLGV